MPTEAGKGVHHVVWCVEPGSWGAVRSFWETTIGIALDELDLPELGLKILISWHGGVEIMTPAYATGLMADAARRFLAERGEGVYAVVYDVRDIEGVVASFAARGGKLLFRERISPEQVAERGLSGPGERFSILQAGFDDHHGLRICLQEIAPE